MSERTSQGAVTLGASGYIGTRLVRRLVEAGGEVTEIDMAPPCELMNGVTYVTTNVRQPLAAASGAGGTAIRNLAALRCTPMHSTNDYYETYLLSTMHAAAMDEASDILLIALNSSISVYGPTAELRTGTTAQPPPLSRVANAGREDPLDVSVGRAWAVPRECGSWPRLRP